MEQPSSQSPWAQTMIPLDVSITRQADASLNAPFIRIWQAFLSGRVLLATALVLLQALSTQLQATASPLVWLVCLGYLTLTVVMRWAAARNLPAPTAGLQWLPVIGVDIAAVFLLQILQSSNLTYLALLAIPILIASALGSMLLAMGTAASVTLLLLAMVSWLHASQGSDATQAYYQTAFTCAGYFGMAYLTQDLSRRVRRERAAALHSRLRTQTQEQVNALVISNLSDGVLVVDQSLRVQQANPAALRLLSLLPSHPPSFSLQTQTAWEPLMDAVQLSFAQNSPLTATVHLQATPQQGRTGLHLRTRITEVMAGDSESADSLCVVFLHDLREMEAQLRTEKLASMGRMSAAVAHEIRNPLAAIVQANALLAEDLAGQPGAQQLCNIVNQNAERLNRIAEEILNIARVQQEDALAQTPPLALDRHAAQTCREWQSQASQQPLLQLHLAAPAQVVNFDEEHLRRVLVNLLDNAQRHRSHAQQAHSLQIVSGHGVSAFIPATAEQSWLQVWSDGAPLESSVLRHLFEPFFSSQSRSSGLGLYICRELCQRYGATISYQRLPRPTPQGMQEGNAFTVVFSSSVGPANAQSLFDLIVV